jgi:hypothetical protein
MSDVDERLTLEVLKRMQQRLLRAETRIGVYEVQLNAFRQHQIEVLRDLRTIYQLLGQHHNRVGDSGVSFRNATLVPDDPN